MKQQLRHLKLFELGISEWPYDIPYEKMKEVVDRNLEGCVIKTHEKWPDHYFFMQNNRYVMDQDPKNDTLWVRYDGFWSIFLNDFSLEYTDVQSIIKFLVEQHLKSKVGTPWRRNFSNNSSVEQHLKSKVGTPKLRQVRPDRLVEQHLKSKVGTPDVLRKNPRPFVVEQHLKSKPKKP